MLHRLGAGPEGGHNCFCLWSCSLGGCWVGLEAGLQREGLSLRQDVVVCVCCVRVPTPGDLRECPDCTTCAAPRLWGAGSLPPWPGKPGTPSPSLLPLQPQVPEAGEAAEAVSSCLGCSLFQKTEGSMLLSPLLFCALYHRSPFFSLVQDYPKNRHPGWSRGSVAYHAGEQRLSWRS